MMAKKWIYGLLVFAMLGIADTALAQEPATAASLYNDGLAKLKAKGYAEALPLFEKAIAAADTTDEADVKVIGLSKRNGAIAAYYAATQLRKEKKTDEASKNFEQGISYDPDFYANYIGRAQIFEDKDKDGEAVKAYFDAAAVCERTNKADKVADLVNKAENIPGVAWGKKQWNNAIAAATAYLEQKESGTVRYYLALSQKEKKQYDEAIENAKKAVELATGEEVDKSNFALGEIYEAAGKKSDAIATYKLVKAAKYAASAKYKVTQLEGGK
jgi:tetratricopeptide (TPR) repeat protein